MQARPLSEPPALELTDREEQISTVSQLGPSDAQTWKIDSPVGALLVGPAIPRDCHYHATPNFVVSLDRPLRFTVENRAIAARSMLLTANTAHSSEGGASLMAWIHLDPLYQLGGLTARMRQLQPGCWVEHEHEDELSAAVHSFLQDPSRSDDLVRTLTHTLGVGAGSQRHADPRVAKAVAMLGADPGEPISLGEISKRVGMSGSAFRRLFKAVTGVTFRRYRVWVRLKLAAELVHSGATFTEAAHEAGFASSAHLSFAYRNLCGVAPSVMLAVMKDGRRPCDIPAFASCQLDVSDELAQLVS